MHGISPHARQAPHAREALHAREAPQAHHAAHAQQASHAPTDFAYRPKLMTCELIAEVLRLLVVERGAERLICRYLADLADRVQRRRELALTRYADELHAARCCFGLGPREARERVRIGRALRQLPEIEEALVEGDMRTLERRVARTQTGAEVACGAEVASPQTRRVTFELSEEAWELLNRALEGTSVSAAARANANRAASPKAEALGGAKAVRPWS